MARYIDADKLANDIYHAWELWEKKGEDCYIFAEVITPMLVGQPTADVKPVVKGEWEMINPQLAKCSVCGGYESTNGKDITGKGVIFKTQKKYCPHCGARMVEE